jgi:hypothetical protein
MMNIPYTTDEECTLYDHGSDRQKEHFTDSMIETVATAFSEDDVENTFECLNVEMCLSCTSMSIVLETTVEHIKDAMKELGIEVIT